SINNKDNAFVCYCIGYIYHVQNSLVQAKSFLFHAINLYNHEHETSHHSTHCQQITIEKVKIEYQKVCEKIDHQNLQKGD
ncbi:MAG: hypothetical protein SGJ02_07080, partial [bacterium]|nr:hypothetical protein [bacterium]